MESLTYELRVKLTEDEHRILKDKTKLSYPSMSVFVRKIIENGYGKKNDWREWAACFDLWEKIRYSFSIVQIYGRFSEYEEITNQFMDEIEMLAKDVNDYICTLNLWRIL